MSTQATKDVARDYEEKFIQNYMDRCCHFTGLQHGTCQRGVAYKSARDGKSISCFQNEHILTPNTLCRERTFPSRENAVEYLRRANIRTQKVREGLCPDCNAELIDNTIKDGQHKGHGSLICPKCEKVKIWI